VAEGRSGRIDRRGLLGWALAGGTAGLLGASPVAGGAAPALPAADARAVRTALSVELLSVFVYGHLVAAGLLRPVAEALARGVLAHELTHVQTLQAELARLGEPAPAPPATVAEADAQLAKLNSSGSLTGVHREIGALDLLYDVEAISIGTYYTALKQLSDPRLMQLALEIMGAEAQHASALGGLLHPGKWDRVVPVASVEGKH
jgi:Ferritin-like domain